MRSTATTPDTAGYTSWVAALTTGGKTVEDLAAVLLADPRYAARVTAG